MTMAEYLDLCGDICPNCAKVASLRQREDTKEWTHDINTEIPGTLGKRMVHAFCLASHFRNKWKDKLSE